MNDLVAHGGLVTVPREALSADARYEWARELGLSLPPAFLEAIRNGVMPADGVDQADALRLRAAFTDRKPASSRLPVSYQRIPPTLRKAIARVLGQWRRRQADQWARFPRWPIDLSADLAADLAGAHSPFAEGPTPVLLSHDLDSPEGLRNAVDLFIALEEGAGARSSHYIVPMGWPMDHDLIQELVGRGHELGIHGYDHSNRTPFAEAGERRRRLEAARPLVERYGIIGYRAPSLLRTRALIADLAGLYRYDSSIPTSGGLFPVPNNGCASARPFRLFGLIEIPVSLPRDGSLLFLGHKPKEILALWQRTADLVARSGGVVSLLTHCEARFSGNPSMLAVYREFLAWVGADGRFAFALPAQILTRMDQARS